MKMLLICSECHPKLTGRLPTMEHVEVTDDGYYVHTCINGHTTLVVNQQQKFEILFENGAHAMIDGYYREAVLSYAASLERFYEFFIRLVSRANKTDIDVFNETWKYVASQSERQLGAYVFLYLYSFQETPKLLPSAKIALRNNVAHKGYIPKKEEALGYGQAVLNIISKILNQLKSHYQEAIHEEIMCKIARGYKIAQEQGLKASTLSTTTIINTNDDLLLEKDLSQEIHKLSQWREMERQTSTHIADMHALGLAHMTDFQK